MKFAGLLSIALATTAIAEPIKRALADYQNVFNAISAQVAVVEGVVTNYVGGSATADDVQDASDDLSTIINNGATSISGFAALTNLEALSLVSPIQTLTGDVGDLVDAVIAAEPNFIADGREADVLASLNAQKTGSEAVRDAITPKVPAALQDIAADLAQGIVDEIERGIAAYSD
ncbi:hydrophobic surface binding protein A-domain-containing protein [Aspergillus pseudoustus]|uniref:Hydrophobic surface binding protein A-domain-containing protein n=1 Tax=Aspergillus pseudoustus TaxID=1810923 RepID=A0ABR4K0P8_9EURO